MAAVEEIESFTDVIPQASMKNTLVVLDIDETMLKFQNGLGSREWWNQTFTEFYKTLNYDEADAKTLELWKNLAETQTVMHTDEYGLGRLIAETRDVGNALIALTARSEKMMEITMRHMETLEIQMDKMNIPAQICPNKQGIFFAGENSKAETLVKICEYLRNVEGMNISRIVFVDDRATNIENMVETVEITDMVCSCFLAKFV